MKKHYPNWKTLPAEVLSKIFQFLAKQETLKDLYNAALVCKVWKVPAQSVLFAHVTITSIYDLETFHSTIERNSYWGTMVKTLELEIYQHKDAHDILTILLFNYLPNLEAFFHWDFISYVPTINALLNSKLKHLSKIQPPGHNTTKREFSHYASCAFLIRNQLQQVYIADDLSKFLRGDIDELLLDEFEHLYNNLGQFKKIKEIDITRKTDDGVKVLEYVLEACKSLKNITFDFSSSIDDQYRSIQLDNTISFDIMSRYIPNSGIKALHGTVCKKLDNGKILLYIIHKFSNLEELFLEFNGMILLDMYTMIQFMIFVSKINRFSISCLKITQDNINKALENFWGMYSRPGGENVKILIGAMFMNGTTNELSISKNNERVGNYISLVRYSIVPDWQPYLEFIEKTGEFIGTLNLAFLQMESYNSYTVLSENLLIHIFTYCSNLRTLEICGIHLDSYRHSMVKSNNRHSIDEIKLHLCGLEYETLEQVSTLLSEIKQLTISNVFHHRNFDKEKFGIRIIMSQTRMNLIILSGYNINFIEILSVTDEKYFYYRVEKNIMEEINEEEYVKSKNDYDQEKVKYKKLYGDYENSVFAQWRKNFSRHRFYICCQTKPEVKLE